MSARTLHHRRQGQEVLGRPGAQGKCKVFVTEIHRLDTKNLRTGGADIRAEHAPKRLDDEVPVDPRKKLDSPLPIAALSSVLASSSSRSFPGRTACGRAS